MNKNQLVLLVILVTSVLFAAAATYSFMRPRQSATDEFLDTLREQSDATIEAMQDSVWNRVERFTMELETIVALNAGVDRTVYHYETIRERTLPMLYEMAPNALARRADSTYWARANR